MWIVYKRLVEFIMMSITDSLFSDEGLEGFVGEFRDRSIETGILTLSLLTELQ